MAAGLQVFNSSGQIRLEITDRLTRLQGTYSLAPWSDASTRFISVSDMVDDGFWTVILPCPDYIAQVGNGGVTIWSTNINFTGFSTVPVTIYRV